MIIRLKDLNQEVRRSEEKRREQKVINEAKRKNPEKTWEWFYEKGYIDNNQMDPRFYKNVNGFWQDQPCWIIGGGPDIDTFIERNGWHFFDDKHTIGINHKIEEYDKFEWFIFLDKRFLDKTTYDMRNYKGRIFAQNTTGIKSDERHVVYTCRDDRPGRHIQDGLFNQNFSGLVALNLAIISGANPIYMVGFGMGKSGNEKDFHSKNYTGAIHNKSRYQKYINVQDYYKAFHHDLHKVIHISDGKDMIMMKKQKINTINLRCRVNVRKKTQPVVAHMSFTSDINKMGDVSRGIINNCYGRHSLHDFKRGIPNADLYILEHFLSTHKHVVNFPYKHKAIDLVHTQNCVPTGNFLKTVALTNAWGEILKRNHVNNLKVIYGGIDLKHYEDIEPDYNNKTFGRITRWSPGKIPPDWNSLLRVLFKIDPELKCLMYVQTMNSSREKINHPQMIYDNSVQISDFKGDALSKMSLYVHANGYFKETMSHAVIEAMATGLPVVYLTEKTGVLEEVTGPAGIRCNNMQELGQAILKLINNPDEKRRLGLLGKEQAKKFDINKTVNNFNQLIKEVM
jgi:glycosyltransferase involved in cell wall biosynthesis